MGPVAGTRSASSQALTVRWSAGKDGQRVLVVLRVAACSAQTRLHVRPCATARENKR
jgi:DUF971 family protein